ncbi:MAG: aspartate/glutamate racemase family protein [Dehalobacterium sp.]|jgi:Asp/Glu/hydantoin racemase
MYQSRDTGINYIVARKQHKCYGMGLGIMILDDVYPGFPGDVRNASAFPFPIQYEIIQGLDIQGLLYQDDKSPFLSPILKAAKNLEAMGCRAIAAECGYFAWFQQDVAGKVDVPVFMSSLLQIPMIQQTLGVNKSVGILCAKKECLTDEHLRRVGVDPASNYFVNGAQDDYQCNGFDTLWDAKVRPEVPYAYFEETEKQMIAIAKDMKQKHPEMGALMLECTGMQPFARAIQREIDLPIYSWGTLLDYAYSVVVHRDYYGHV